MYDLLLDEAYCKGITVYEHVKFESNSKGLVKGNKIALSHKLNTIKERTCVLAEELAHKDINVGDIINQNNIDNRKQEYKARKLTFDRMVGLTGIIDAYKYGCRSLFDMSEFLDVPQEFLENSLECYKKRYGVCITIDTYIIYFEPILQIGQIY